MAAKAKDKEEETDEGAPPMDPPPVADLPKGAKESEPVYDPVDDYPERPYAEASEGVHRVVHHTEDGRYNSLQLEQDPESGGLRRSEGVEGPIVNHDYVEEVVMVDGEVRGYFGPKYD